MAAGCTPPATPRGGAQSPAPPAADRNASESDRGAGSSKLQPVAVQVPAQWRRAPFDLARSLHLPPGFQISVFASGLNSPRLMAFSPEGELYVSLPRAGSVVKLPDRDGDGVADQAVPVATGLNRPHGLAFHNGSLYVAETNRVVRLTPAGVDVVVPDLPAGGQHWTRTIGFGPDGMLYVAAGSSCNVCREQDERRAAIMQFRPDGSGGRIYARGLRNAVGLAWHPETGELWATENGRDHLGDDLPPDEINVVRAGSHYGWPQCYGNRVVDAGWGSEEFCRGTQPPAVALQAHSAPLGLNFYLGTQFPESYLGHLFVALHGSWNRTEPTGYKLIRVRPDGVVEDFATGWLAGRLAWGRPVQPVVGPDGALYVSDDHAGAIYRIWYAGR